MSVIEATTKRPRAADWTPLRAIGWPRVDSVGAWAIALVCIALAGLAHPPLDAVAGEPLPPFITFYPAVVLSALAGGWRIGVAAAVITLLLAWYFFTPDYFSFTISGARTPLTLLIYAISATFLGWVVGQARLALDDAVRAEAKRAEAARESVHRIKNLLAVVQALVAKISREVETTTEYKNVLSQRLAALDIAQGVLIRRDWSDVALGDMIDQAMAPFLPNPGLTVVRGPSVVAPARFVPGLCMALYELCTNGMKYGRLGGGEGPASLTWRLEGDQVVIEWDEATTTQTGHGESFGTQLIRGALGREPNTSVDYAVEHDRVHAVFRWKNGATG